MQKEKVNFIKMFLVCSFGAVGFFVPLGLSMSTGHVSFVYADTASSSVSGAPLVSPVPFESRADCIKKAVAFRKQSLKLAKDTEKALVAEAKIDKKNAEDQADSTYDQDILILKSVRDQAVKNAKLISDTQSRKEALRVAREVHKTGLLERKKAYDDSFATAKQSYLDTVANAKSVYKSTRQSAWDVFNLDRQNCPKD